MQRLAVLALFLSVATGAFVPYFENFENGAGGWTSGILSGTANDWRLGRPTKTNFVGAYSGNNSWVTSLTGNYANSQNSFIQSPDFDFSNNTGTALVFFRLRYSCEAGTEFYDGLRFEYNYNGNWSILGNVGEFSWYNAPVLVASGAAGWGGDSADFQTNYTYTGHALPSVLNGKSGVKFRFVFQTDSSVGDLGVSIDDFEVSLQAVVPQCVTVTSPANGVVVSTQFTISWNPAGDNPLGYDVYVGSSPTPSRYASFPASNGVVAFAPPGTFYYQIVPSNYGVRAVNCPVRSAVNTPKPVPYFNDFETSAEGWASAAVFTNFVLGTPSRSVINRAYSGQKAWVTGLTGSSYFDGEKTELRTPFFDFATVGQNISAISFALWYDSEEEYDGTNVQYSEDGFTWTTLGAQGDPSNWYTDLSITSLGAQPAWSGSLTNYTIVSHVLPLTLRGKVVAFRFNFASDSSGSNYNGAAIDDFRILSYPPSPSQCVNYTLPVNGSAALNPTTLTWSTSDRETNGVLLYISTDPLFAGVTPIDLGFSQRYTLPILLSGTYYWRVSPYGAAGITQGCSVRSFVIVDVTVTVPYFQNFESGPAGWSSVAFASNNINTWALGYPNKTIVQGTASGVNAWVTGGLTGNYSAFEVSYVQSPIFDLRGLTQDPVFSFKIVYSLENGYDGVLVQVASSNSSWRTLGAVQSSAGVNWYQYIDDIPAVQNQGFGDYAWTNDSNWVTASHTLTGTAGSLTRLRVVLVSDLSIVRPGFAFDDVSITPVAPPTSAQPTGVPTSAPTNAATSNPATNGATSNPATNGATSAQTNAATSAATISNPVTQPVTRPATAETAVSVSSQLKAAFFVVAFLAALL